jgi:hypothetical protein
MVIGWVLDGALDWLAERVRAALGWLVALLTSAFFTSPDVTVFPQAQALAQRSTLVVNACFGLVVVVAGAIGMGHGSVQIRYEVKDLIPRLVFAFVISNFGVQLCQAVITVVNAVTESLIGTTAAGPRVVEYVQAEMTGVLVNPGMRLLAVIIAVIIVVLLFQLLFTWVARVVTLLVLAGVAPIALACYALPQTEPVAQLWWRLLAATLATPLLQGVTFSLGVDLLVNPDHNLPDLLGSPTNGVVNLFFVAALLALTVRIPRLLARYAGTRAQPSTVGLVARAVVVQGATRRLPGARRLIR